MTDQIPAHFHKKGAPEGQVSAVDVVPDGKTISVVPTFAAPEGTEVSYHASGIVRRYRMVDGTWRGATLVNILSGSVTYDPPSLADGVGTTTTVTVTGAVLGDFAQVSFSLDLQGITVTAWVSAANTVSVRFQNESGGTLDLSSGTLQARVIPAAQY